MPIWIIIAALATVGVTLLLTSILWRANMSSRVHKPDGRDADVPLYEGSGSAKSRQDDAAGGESGADGGGDGGGD